MNRLCFSPTIDNVLKNEEFILKFNACKVTKHNKKRGGVRKYISLITL